ncbi:MAG: DUF2974 domain-containing protein [Lachnospiraceae bacterium]|nr:DUF2974 domain-containing protein [Lachnospiraceae bacterium]
MSNILDYLDWRGDICIADAPFNEVDNLLLSELSYVALDRIVPGLEEDASITVKEAEEVFFSRHNREEIYEDHSLMAKAPLVLEKMAKVERFQDMRLSCYVNQIDEREEKQFSALVAECQDTTCFVAFRGTDDTLVGWKEDFNMSYISAVPSQLEAVSYLERVAEKVTGRLRLGGHSKGGNLAVYAAVKCKKEVQDRIIGIYNNDGPGFSKEMLTSREYNRVRERIWTIVPQTSIVGMLLEHEEEYLVTKSSQSGIMQHDPLSWEVLGAKFVYLEEVKKNSRILDRTLKNWINKMTREQREEFVMALFHVFDEMGAKNLSELSEDKLGNLGALIKTIKHMTERDQEMLMKVIRGLIGAYKDVVKEEYLPERLKGNKK